MNTPTYTGEAAMLAEIERLRAALEPFARCAAEDESEVDYLCSRPGAVAIARSVYQQRTITEK